MARINLDIDFLTHPKIVGLDPLSELLFIRSLLYCARHLTDGFLPTGAVDMLTHNFAAASAKQKASTLLASARPLPASASETSPLPADRTQWIRPLLKAKLWHTVAGGYRIHDYLDYQLSKKQVDQLIDNKREAGRKGGLAKALAAGLADGKQKASRGPSRTLAESTPIPIPILREKKEKNPLSFSPCEQPGGNLADRTTKGIEKAIDPEQAGRAALKRLGITLPRGQA